LLSGDLGDLWAVLAGQCGTGPSPSGSASVSRFSRSVDVSGLGGGLLEFFDLLALLRSCSLVFLATSSGLTLFRLIRGLSLPVTLLGVGTLYVLVMAK